MTPPARTGEKILQIRTSEQQYEALERLARLRGLDKSKLVRERFPEVFKETRLSRPEKPPTPIERVDVAEWVSERNGMPVALVRRALANGHIRIGGEVCTDPDIEPGQLLEVTLDWTPIG